MSKTKAAGKVRKPSPCLGRYVEESFRGGWVVLCCPLKEPYFLDAKQCRTLSAWLIRAAKWIDQQTAKRGKKTRGMSNP